MADVVLKAETTTALKRMTVHGQYNRRAFGFHLLTNIVPIVLCVRQPGPHYKRSILIFGQKRRNRSPYEDFGIIETCCRKVYTFNIRHYVKCYLNAPNPEPFTFNLCQVCGATVTDQNGHTIQSIVKRSFRPDKFVWSAPKALQSDTGSSPAFNFHDGVA